ncbi:AfsR/SARP family transcriptional regulator [Deinococcus cellulosilyticus]|uniref:Bacterial transcriptional activator domain-containing protein n=1 Tax=Deinococcus cellulosilyticus (strain DSM 18568 / NBRC 106333 / KACC 11606 / 5516J-15) TaxID=1223518 RepID=A0A511N1W4_DEIC1|nr:BTAD domain-containing putative transcriptional regulator [Deinococcus cellulosilyticus]GEM46843.1 hypothetical protein DC3_24780 [Deinococcus cellulosilyticus NBRC 106333 = KACC 11606]
MSLPTQGYPQVGLALISAFPSEGHSESIERKEFMGRKSTSVTHRTVQVHLLGTPCIQHGKRSRLLKPEKALWLLTFLAAQDRWVSREELCALLWPDAEHSKARHSLRQLLQRIYSLKWTTTLEVEVDCLRWKSGSDLHEFRRCVRVGLWEEALAHHRGTLLQGLHPADLEEYDSWLELERDRLHTEWLQVSSEQARALGARGLEQEALHLLGDVLQHDPLSEQALQHYIRLAQVTGSRDQAVRHYLQFSRALKTELGLEPSAETRTLCEALLEGQRFTSMG